MRKRAGVLGIVLLLALKLGVDWQLQRQAGARRDYFESKSLASPMVGFPRPIGVASKGPSSKYAYAFVVGGCNPEEPAYRGFVFNILIATRLLRQFGSKADVVAFFQMSHQSAATELPDEDLRSLRALGVKILYIAKSDMESFYDTVMHKFNILGLVQYRRVLLLDGDVMPVANLDYLFALSDGANAILQENVVVSGPWEPANGGFFMLAPGDKRLERVEEIICVREKDATRENGVDGHFFSAVTGWGHTIIEPPDEWVARSSRGTNWTFHFAFSDQGLLYYYVKYLRKSVSIIQDGTVAGTVENWAADENGKVRKVETFTNPFSNYSKPVLRDRVACAKWMCDFVHFSGDTKPWLSEKGLPIYLSETSRFRRPHHLWWWTLRELNTELSMGLDLASWRPLVPGKPSLGLFATLDSTDARVTSRRHTNYTGRPSHG